MVHDVAAAIEFYTTHLGFSVEAAFGPAFGSVRRGSLVLHLSGEQSSAGRPMPDGRKPEPGGWNRIHLIVDDVDAEAAKLRAAGVVFRNEVIRGPGGAQTVLDDPSGNPVELFQPAANAPG
jgi:catechol 2,3-dioxygenase-like lactoylglutathione lyase family enzyme